MACASSISGYTYSCPFSSKGGVKAIYVANYSDSAYTMSDGAVSSVSGATWYKYEVRKEQSSMESTSTIDNNGSNFVTTNATLVFSKMNAAARIEANALLKGEFLVIVRDANDVYHALGVDEPVMASEGSATTGTARTDANNYTVVLTDIADNFPPHLSEAAIAQLAA